jgi:hypothetical protein
MPSPSRLLACLSLLAALTLAGCAGGPRRVVNPPRASVQELAVQDDGQWRISVRLQNFSNVPTQFADVDASLEVGGQPGFPLRLQPAMAVGPESADVVVVTVAPSAAAKTAVESALSARRSVRYRISGRIVTSDPRGTFQFEYESALSPVPGLPGVMR